MRFLPLNINEEYQRERSLLMLLSINSALTVLHSSDSALAADFQERLLKQFQNTLTAACGAEYAAAHPAQPKDFMACLIMAGSGLHPNEESVAQFNQSLDFYIIQRCEEISLC